MANRDISTNFVIESEYDFLPPVNGEGRGFCIITHYLMRLSTTGDGSHYTPSANSDFVGETRRGKYTYALYVTYMGNVPENFAMETSDATRIVNEMHRKVTAWKR